MNTLVYGFYKCQIRAIRRVLMVNDLFTVKYKFRQESDK